MFNERGASYAYVADEAHFVGQDSDFSPSDLQLAGLSSSFPDIDLDIVRVSCLL